MRHLLRSASRVDRAAPAAEWCEPPRYDAFRASRHVLVETLPQLVHLADRVVEGARGVDHHVGDPQTRLVRHLRCDACCRISRAQPAQSDQPLDAHLGRGVRHHDELPRVVDARLDEQRHVVDDDGIGVGSESRREAAGGFGAHGRMHDRVELRDRRRVSEHAGAESRAIQRAVGDAASARRRSLRSPRGPECPAPGLRAPADPRPRPRRRAPPGDGRWWTFPRRCLR